MHPIDRGMVMMEICRLLDPFGLCRLGRSMRFILTVIPVEAYQYLENYFWSFLSAVSTSYLIQMLLFSVSNYLHYLSTFLEFATKNQVV